MVAHVLVRGRERCSMLACTGRGWDGCATTLPQGAVELTWVEIGV
jgi:hypothetical protein